MAGPQTLVPRRIHQLRSPRMAELITVADEHVQDRHLLAFWGFRVVVAVVGVASRGQEPQVAPATLAREVADPVWI